MPRLVGDQRRRHADRNGRGRLAVDVDAPPRFVDLGRQQAGQRGEQQPLRSLIVQFLDRRQVERGPALAVAIGRDDHSTVIADDRRGNYGGPKRHRRIKRLAQRFAAAKRGGDIAAALGKREAHLFEYLRDHEIGRVRHVVDHLADSVVERNDTQRDRGNQHQRESQQGQSCSQLHSLLERSVIQILWTVFPPADCNKRAKPIATSEILRFLSRFHPRKLVSICNYYRSRNFVTHFFRGSRRFNLRKYDAISFKKKVLSSIVGSVGILLQIE